MSKNNLNAILSNPHNGRDCEYESVSQFEIGQKFEVEWVHVGNSQSHFKIVDLDNWFNTVQFEFCDDDGGPVDIYSDSRWLYYCWQQHDESAISL